VAGVVAFLRPTRLKLAFLVEWVLFVLISAAQGKLQTSHHILTAVYPSILLYLAACAFTVWSQRTPQLARGRRLWALALGFTLLDQAIKAMVFAFVPYQASIPIIDGCLHLAQEHNPQGSWVAGVLNLQSGSIFHVMQWLLAVAFLCLSVLCHRYYTTNNRHSLWVDLAFLGLFAGVASWVCDMALRGYIIDFINLPGLVTIDLKDVLVTISVGAILAEALDNPQVTWRWQGWRKEGEDLLNLGADLLSFSLREVRERKR
jgi:lipoprotein signal peptidase